MDRKPIDLERLSALVEELSGSDSGSELQGLVAGAVEELSEARSALTKIMDLVSQPAFWDNPTDTLEHIGDAVNSDRYPLWERYEEQN